MNKKFFFFLVFLLMSLLSGHLYAQVPIERSKEITKIGGKEYYMHHVKSGQTLYGISQVYNVTVEEIEKLNPEIKKSLNAGHVLGIPVRPVQEPKVEPVEKPKEEPKFEPKVELVEKPEVEPKEEPKVQPVEKPKVEPKEGFKVEPVEKPKVEPKEEPKVEPVEKPKVEPKEEPKVEPVEKPKVEPKEEPKVEPVEKLKNDPKEEQEAVSQNGSTKVESKPKEKPQGPIKKELYSSKGRIVQVGEDLYDIAKECGIDISDLKSVNPDLSNNPVPGTAVIIPPITNENDYIVHYCERNERVTSLLKRWKVDENAFRAKNISVGSHIFENQVVLIPIEPVTDFYWMDGMPELVVVQEQEAVNMVEEEETPIVPVERPQLNYDFEMSDIPVCQADPANAHKRYRVALMVPLYLYDIDNLSISKEKSAKTQKSRSMSFLQFYEGFMIAAEVLEKQGLKLDLTVIDVTDNVSTAERALSQIRGKELDLIVGPFFGKSFAVIEEYAKANGIVVVNPLSTRESVLENSPNVVKVKPGDIGMILSISNLVKNYYSNANVFIVSREKAADTAFLNQLEHHLNLAVNEEVTVSGDEFLNFARDESERMEMGSRLVPTLDVEGQVYSTDDFQNGSMDKVVMANSIRRYAYSEMGALRSHLSGVRTNLIIAYGDDNVFATQILNALTKSADRFPITLVCATDWQKYEKLLVENLLKMNAIYVSDFFVDYQDDDAKRFVRRFRDKYVSEPQNYAFEGYDVGYYFLNALMQYGSDDLIDCLHCYEASLLHTHYSFYYKNYLKAGDDYGKENLYWSIYQYDKENIELVPINPFKKVSDYE